MRRTRLYIFAPKSGYLLKIVGRRNHSDHQHRSRLRSQTNVPASSAFVVGQRVYDNSGIALDPAGNLYVADSRDGRLCKIDTQGMLTTLAGNGAYGYGGDGGPALGAMIQGPSGMTQTPDGTIYFLDTLKRAGTSHRAERHDQHRASASRIFHRSGGVRASERDHVGPQRQCVRPVGASRDRIDAQRRDPDHRQSAGSVWCPAEMAVPRSRHRS